MAVQRTLSQAVASSVDAPAALLPVLDELFTGVPSLGSSPRTIVRLLEDAGVRPGQRVLELACGKGTLAVMMAHRLGVRVDAIDGHPPFVDHARAAATRAGMSERVTFSTGDVRRSVTRGTYDAALMIGLFELEEASRVLRRRTRSGGVYIVDDCFLDPAYARRSRVVWDVPTKRKCASLIESLGDRVERVLVPSPSALRTLNTRLYERIARNARRVGSARPKLRPALREFLRRQREANHVLGSVLRPAVWVVRRA